MDIRKWTFEIAEGKASAVMRQGSFRHRDEISHKRPLNPLEKDGAYTLRDPLTMIKGILSMEDMSVTTREGDLCRIRHLHLDLAGTNANEARDPVVSRCCEAAPAIDLSSSWTNACRRIVERTGSG